MLDLAIFDLGGARLRPPTARVERLRFSTGRHGHGTLSATLPMPSADAFWFYDHATLADVQLIGNGGAVLWRGRVEDVELVEEGIRIAAFGYARAMMDLRYTALWSKTSSADFRPATVQEISVAANGRYEMDNNNRTWIAIKKGEQSNTSTRGVLVYEMPARGVREATIMSFSYDVAVTGGSTYVLVLRGYNDSWTQISTSTVASTSTTATGTHSFTFAAGVTKVAALFSRNSGTLTTYTGDTGGTYARMTDLRLITNSLAPVLASDIARALASDVAGVNASQLSSETVLVQNTAQDLQDEIYADMTHAEILDSLAERQEWQWGVWADKRLRFEPQGTGGRQLLIDVAELRVERSLEPLENRVYATYKTASGRELRTAATDDTANDTASQAKFVVRTGVVAVQTTSATEAAVWRDARLAKFGNYAVRAEVKFQRLYTKTGQLIPLYELRANDVIEMRNLPPTISPDVDNIRTFRVVTTDYDNDSYRVVVEPDVPLPTLVTLVARGPGNTDGEGTHPPHRK